MVLFSASHSVLALPIGNVFFFHFHLLFILFRSLLNVRYTAYCCIIAAALPSFHHPPFGELSSTLLVWNEQGLLSRSASAPLPIMSMYHVSFPRV